MRAVTVPLDTDLDLNDIARADGYLFVREGVGFAGRGVAARVPVDDAVGFLAAIDHDDRTGGATGPIAIGALPFLPGAPADLIVPAAVVGKSAAGHRWITTIDDADESLLPATEPEPTASNWSIRPGVDVEHYLAAVASARDAVRGGRMDKAVIARPIQVEADRPIDVHAVLRRLKATFGSSYRFSVDGFIGASPELLVGVDGDIVSAHPLAGTTRTTGDPKLDAALAAELQASAKNQIEHRVAIEMVRDTLLPYCSYLDWAPEPSIVKVANVQHLGSQAEGMLSKPTATVVELVRALQPTPAVGGYPRSAAIELITEVEGFERGVYGGAVGWCDGSGNGQWAVSLRCAELSDDRRSARLVAGGGIVADSDPHAELAETQAKFQAMLSAIVRP
ncbi:MAG: isochorismate synthase [Ilumatobacter sp.]|uniref:isochorismate synthase n=1 Tax=Ilumatobacter sp. TaxID=1967498 RepID=UPI002607F790|nr:isochorismate synthase [Ilumatobacter sp.]MDJ0770546.1 isochorismate synthase [Ilumatobacter sp.]